MSDTKPFELHIHLDSEFEEIIVGDEDQVLAALDDAKERMERKVEAGEECLMPGDAAFDARHSSPPPFVFEGPDGPYQAVQQRDGSYNFERISIVDRVLRTHCEHGVPIDEAKPAHLERADIPFPDFLDTQEEATAHDHEVADRFKSNVHHDATGELEMDALLELELQHAEEEAYWRGLGEGLINAINSLAKSIRVDTLHRDSIDRR